MDERQYFVSLLYHHEFHLRNDQPTSPKDRVQVAKALRTLLANQLLSMDRVVMATCILLWPSSHPDNLYHLDLASVQGIAHIIEAGHDPDLALAQDKQEKQQQKMSAAVASELGFIVAILGFYSFQVSKDLALKFVHWLSTAVTHNTQFKATVLGMLLTPHHPLPPPPLRPVNSLDDILAPAIDPLLTLATQVVLAKPAPSLLHALAVKYFDKTIPTILPQLMDHPASRDAAVQALVSSPSPSSSSSPSPTTRDPLLAQRLFDLALDSLGAHDAATSLQPFQLDPGTSKTLRILPFATLTTQHVLGWMHLLAHLHPPPPKPPSSASASAPSSQTSWPIDKLGALLTLVLRRAKKLAPLVRSVLDASGPRTTDWWLALHMDFWTSLVAARGVADWADVLARALETAGTPPSALAVRKLLAKGSPIWVLRNKYACAGNDAGEQVLDALDRVLVALLTHDCGKAPDETEAEAEGGVDRANFVVEHFKVWVAGGREATGKGGGAAAAGYCARLVKCVVAAGDARARAPLRGQHAACVRLAAELVRVLLDAFRDAESDVAGIGVYALIPQLLAGGAKWRGQEAASVLVDLAGEPFLPAKWRVLALEAFDGAEVQWVTVEQLEALVERVFGGVAATSVRVALAKFVGRMPSATLAGAGKRTLELLALFAAGEYDDDADGHALAAAAAQVLSALSQCTIAHALPPIEPTTLITFKLAVMASPHTGMFRQHHFTHLLGDASASSTSALPMVSITDMRAIFQATATFPLPSPLLSSRAALHFYLSWELARYCMLTRFKTPMGAAPATLSGIELLVHRKHALALHTVNALDRWFASVKTGPVDAGAVSNVPALPKNMQAFFVSNEAVMDEWMTRMRRAAARAAASGATSAADTVRHGLELLRVDGPRGSHAAKADWPTLGMQAAEFGWNDVVRGVAAVTGRGLRAEWALARGEVEKVRKMGLGALAGKTAARALEGVAATYVMVGEYKEVRAFAEKVAGIEGVVCDGECMSLLRELAESSKTPASSGKVGITNPLPPIGSIRSQLIESMPILALDGTTTALPTDSSVHASHHALHSIFHVDLRPAESLAVRLAAVHHRLGNLVTAQACLSATASNDAQFQRQLLKIHAAALGRVSLQLAAAQPAMCASLVRRGLLACDSDMDQVLRDVVAKSQQQTAQTMLALMGLDGMNADPAGGGANDHADLVSRMEALSMGPDNGDTEGQHRVAQMVHSLLTAAVRVDPNEAHAWRQLGDYYATHVPEPVYLATTTQSTVDAEQAVELAVSSYARYLDLVVSPLDKHRANVVAMRLVHLIELHAEVLAQRIDATHLASVTSANAHTWTFLMPQLTAMLVHPHPFPSTFAGAIIKQLARYSPSACVYPLVALDLERPDLQVTSRLLGSIDSHGIVETTRVLVEHAQRLTVLWDEQWHHSLASLQGAVLRRSMSVPDMISELEKLTQSHLNYPVTAHELAFQASFMHKIHAAVAGVKAAWAKVGGGGRAVADLEELGPDKWRGVVKQVWKPLHPLVVALNNVVNRGRSLQLEHVGLLHGLDFSAGCLPGTSTGIASIVPGFFVLPTKTKPKKISFIAEDGSTHAYLLKGLEDLRLDERMVQVFEAVNHMLADSADRGGNRDAAALLRQANPSRFGADIVRSYSVVPLGHLGGFIQWVPAIPIYSIYKRQYLALHANQSPPKPLAAFNAAARKVLGLTGAVPVSSLRKNCSDDQLLDIFKMLCSGERGDGIRNTLYLATTSSWSAIQTQRRFAHSVAAASMVGHVLGLGDRHLDNVLLDVANGQVVHIDYNVSFDRGAALRIPELVPFRLTRSFVEAMGGDVGVRGAFSVAAEVVLDLLRKHRAYIVQLLESMVMDEQANWDVVAGLGSGAAPAVDDDGEANVGAVGEEDEDDEESEVEEQVSDRTVSGPVSQESASESANPLSSDGVGCGSSADHPNDGGRRRRQVTSEGQALDGEKREQAVRVLRNVMSKLDGGQLGGGEPLAVSQHVAQLIDLAMDESRLSQMFEGWTPWI